MLFVYEKNLDIKAANTWKLLVWKKTAEKATERIPANCNLRAWNKSLNSRIKHVNSSEGVEKLEKKNKYNSVLYRLQWQWLGSEKPLVSTNETRIGVSLELQN